MATMTYCAFENTAGDMRVCLEKLNDTSELEELDEHEGRALFSLRRMCEKFLIDSERFVENE